MKVALGLLGFGVLVLVCSSMDQLFQKVSTANAKRDRRAVNAVVVRYHGDQHDLSNN